MDAFVVHPDEGGPFPSVVVLMDIWGLREELFDVARRVAVVGYHCVLPNFWYRRGKVRFEFRDEKGRMKSLLALPQEVQDEIQANMRQVTDRMAMADIGAVLKYPRRRAGAQGVQRVRSAIVSAAGSRSPPRPNFPIIFMRTPACTVRGWSPTSRTRRIV